MTLRVRHANPDEEDKDFKVTRTTNLTDFLWQRYKQFRTGALKFSRPSYMVRIRTDATPTALGMFMNMPNPPMRVIQIRMIWATRCQLRPDPYETKVPDVTGRSVDDDDNDSGWGNLPLHILETIFGYIEDQEDVGCCMLVSKRWSLESAKPRVRAITRSTLIDKDDINSQITINLDGEMMKVHPIMLAAQLGNVDVVRLLLSNGVRVDNGIFDTKIDEDSVTQGVIGGSVVPCGAPDGMEEPDMLEDDLL